MAILVQLRGSLTAVHDIFDFLLLQSFQPVFLAKMADFWADIEGFWDQNYNIQQKFATSGWNEGFMNYL